MLLLTSLFHLLLFQIQDGSLPVTRQEPVIKSLSDLPSPKNAASSVTTPCQAPVVSNSTSFGGEDRSTIASNLAPALKQMEISPTNEREATNQRSSDALERARAAIAAAERASAAARAAAELVNTRAVRQGSSKQSS